MGGTPAMWNALMQHSNINKYDISSVTDVSSATATFATKGKKRRLRTFSNATYGEAYGQTETTSNVTGSVSGIKKAGNIEHPLYNTEIKLVSLNIKRYNLR